MKKRVLSVFLACLLLLSAIPTLALAVTAEGAEVLTSTWDQSDPACMDIDMREDIREGFVRMFVWYDADGNLLPVDGYAEGSTEKNEYTCMDDGCYAILNPELYTLGVFKTGMTNDEIWEAYGEYLMECSRITYGGAWSVGNMVDGEFVKTENRCFVYHAKGLYNVRKNRSAGAIFPTDGVESNGQFCTTWENAKRYYDEFVALGKEDCKIGADGKVYWSDIAEDDFYLRRISDYDWNPGAGGFSVVASHADAAKLAFVLRPDSYGPVSLRYTVPAGVYGTMTLDLGDAFDFYVSGGLLEAQGVCAVALNGEIVWPADAVADDKSTWAKVNETASIAKLNEQLAALPTDVRSGDTVDIFVARDGSGKISLDIKPTVSIEKKYLVEYRDQNGKVIFDALVAPGAALPAAPVGSKDGFYINGMTEAVTELPATVTANMSIKYAGDYDVQEITVEKSEINYAYDFSVTLYMQADPKAKIVGVADYDGREYYAVKQDDGRYKVTLPGTPAKDIVGMVYGDYYYPFQEFEGGVDASNERPFVINPYEIMVEQFIAGRTPLAAPAYIYAIAAQAYFNGETNLREDEKDMLDSFYEMYDEEIRTLPKEFSVEGEGDYRVARATLVCKETVSLKIAVEMTELTELSESDLDLTVLVNGEEFNGFTFQQDTSKTAMVITLDGINAADFDEMFEITVMDGMKRKSGTLSYSVNTYIARTFEGGEGETDNLLRALYALGAAANA